MSNQAGWFTGAVEQVKADAASRIEVGWDWALPGGASHAVRARRTRGIALAVVLVCLLALPPLTPAEAIPPPAPAIAPDAPGDEYWAEGFNSLGMSDTVSAMAFGPDGSLYAGGEFTTAGSVIARYIARWDGAQWYPLGSGMGGSDPYPFVYDLAFGPDGSLYAGGDFTTAGGVAANHIARWDGATSSWHPLGSGMNSGIPWAAECLDIPCRLSMPWRLAQMVHSTLEAVSPRPAASRRRTSPCGWEKSRCRRFCGSRWCVSTSDLARLPAAWFNVNGTLNVGDTMIVV